MNAVSVTDRSVSCWCVQIQIQMLSLQTQRSLVHIVGCLYRSHCDTDSGVSRVSSSVIARTIEPPLPRVVTPL